MSSGDSSKIVARGQLFAVGPGECEFADYNVGLCLQVLSFPHRALRGRGAVAAERACDTRR